MGPKKIIWRSFFILFIVLIVSSSGMYIVEKDVQPEKFISIPQAMWWSIVTLTTVGYGDAFPVTSAGKIFGSVIIILGIGTVLSLWYFSICIYRIFKKKSAKI